MTVPLLNALISGHTAADFHLSQNSPVLSKRLTIFAIDGMQCLSTLLGMLWGRCQVCMVLMTSQVWFCIFFYQSVLKIPPDVVCHLVWCVFMCAFEEFSYVLYFVEEECCKVFG